MPAAIAQPAPDLGGLVMDRSHRLKVGPRLFRHGGPEPVESLGLLTAVAGVPPRRERAPTQVDLLCLRPL